MAALSKRTTDRRQYGDRRCQYKGRHYHGDFYAFVCWYSSLALYLQEETPDERPCGIFCGIFLDAEAAPYRSGTSVWNGG